MAVGGPVTNEAVVTIRGVESGSDARNALVRSRVLFVLRWNAPDTDLDIYATDRHDRTIWHGNVAVGPGSFDSTDDSTNGPEVVSYATSADDVYVNGDFGVDVHYYGGLSSTDYTLDVILNEAEAHNRRFFRFVSTRPHTTANPTQGGPNGSGASRFNDVVRVTCSTERVCTLSGFDSNKLDYAKTLSD